MQHRHFLLALALLLPASAVNAIEPSDLKPGLLAQYIDVENAVPGKTVFRLEPTVAITLHAGESPHPTLKPNGRYMWEGYVNMTRRGSYTFSATVRGGKLNVVVGGKRVLAVEANDQEPSTKVSEEITFEGGVAPFLATFVHTGKEARVELFWQGPGFIKEPLAHQFLGHLAKDRPQEFTIDGTLEHGRFKFEELACVKCHRAAADDKMAKTLVDRTGPNLTDVAKRTYAGWIYTW